MPNLSTKCATVASVLSLATLPSDRSRFDDPLPEKEFKTTRGYERKVIGDVICHAVDWDGAVGAESVFRENGKRSGALWREFRGWRKETPSSSLLETGNTACSLLLKHFGPYDHVTSEALARRRAVEKERFKVEKNFEKDCPLSLRTAAKDYLAVRIGYFLRAPSPLSYITEPVAPILIESINGEKPLFTAEKPEMSGPSSSSEAVLRDYAAGTEPPMPPSSLELVAKSIIEKARPFEEQLDLLDVKLLVSRLPPIPGERCPADMDLIHYGSLICRHRAVIAALLLADAGFDVEIVEGKVRRDGHSGGHLFVFTEAMGILEPSADGPNFWRKTEIVSHDGVHMLITVDNDTVYEFGNRTKIPHF